MPAPSVNVFSSYVKFCFSFSCESLAMVLFREFVEIADKCQCVDGWSKSSYFGRRCCSIHISHYHVYKKGPKVCRETSHFFQPCWNCGKITTVISFKALTIALCTTSYYLTWKNPFKQKSLSFWRRTFDILLGNNRCEIPHLIYNPYCYHLLLVQIKENSK